MINLPQESGLAEFGKFEVRDCEMVWKEGRAFVRWDGKERALSEFDVTMGVDPAATEKYVSAKTSQSAVSVVAQNAEKEKFVLWQKWGYVSIITLFDWVFEGVKKFAGSIRVCVFERAAFQKVLEPLAVRERVMRGQFVSFDSVPALGDKDARIRARIGSDLERKMVYAERGLTQFRAEVKAFPQSHMKDCLDSVCLAVEKSSAPASEKEARARKRMDLRFKRRVASVVGW
jgi:hypothetical protein